MSLQLIFFISSCFVGIVFMACFFIALCRSAAGTVTVQKVKTIEWNPDPDDGIGESPSPVPYTVLDRKVLQLSLPKSA